jgi:pimeloyl-ACP methyl ester carboxylesterase
MSYLENFKHEITAEPHPHKLVFLHGVMGSAANWRRVIPAFEDKFQVLSYDQRGHGWSFKPATGYSPEDYSLDLKMILDELNWNKISLVGHSMGGRNALHFAQKYPQRVEALVIEDIGPEGNIAAMKKTIGLVEMVPVPFASKEAAKAYFNGEFTAKLGGGKGAVVLAQYFYTNIENRPDGTANWRFSKDAILSSLVAGHFKPRWDAVQDMKIPTLFVRGERSEDFPRAEFDKVLQVNPAIRGVEIAGAGHWVHFDNAQEFIRVVSEFLALVLKF